MSEPIIIAMIVAIPPTLAAILSAWIGLANMKKSDGIHVLVNSNLTKVKQDLEIALKKVESLENVLTKRL